MSKCFCCTLPNGKVAVIHLAPGQDETLALAKTMFELTRPTTPAGRAEHFDPANPAHRRGPQVRQMDDADLPADRSVRDAWEEHPGGVRVNVVKAGEIRARR